jgi:hypothetical protein
MSSRDIFSLYFLAQGNKTKAALKMLMKLTQEERRRHFVG